jgi:hypothetical protein
MSQRFKRHGREQRYLLPPSKHAAMSYARMQEAEQRYEQEIAELLTQTEAADAEEDARYGAGRRGDELTEELRFCQTRRQRFGRRRPACRMAAGASGCPR